MSFQLPNLSYDHSALEPHIDSKTMQIHHGKHHAGYTNKLNAAIDGTDLAGKSIEEILKSLDRIIQLLEITGVVITIIVFFGK